MRTNYERNKDWRKRNVRKRNAERLRHYKKHARNKVRSGAIWTEDEITLIQAKSSPDVALSLLLHRSVQAIQGKRNQLKKAKKQ